MSLILGVSTIIMGLVSQKVFINVLGAEYLGINGLFTSIVSMLALAELGLGSAIYYHLYKPVADNDIVKIKSLVNFFKNGYRLIAGAVFALGLCVVPFLHIIVRDVKIDSNIYLIFMLFIIDIVASYLLIYKKAVLYVDQNNHIISKIHLAYLIVLNSLQIAALIITGNFYLYLIIKILMRIAENVALTYITNKKYVYLKDKSSVALDKVTRSDIYKKVRGLSYHKVAEYVVLGTDNIVISVFFGIATVGLYSNYLLVIGAISMLVGQAFVAITASVGNLLAKANSKKSHEVYSKLQFGNFWLACFATTSLLVIMNSFISVWIGEKFLLSIGVLIALSLNMYLTLTRSAIGSFKEAAGIFHEDRFVPVVESIANIVFSLTLLHFFGLAGVFLGTAGSTLILHLFSYPKYVYKPLFKRNVSLYYLEFVKYFMITLIISGVTFAISRSIELNNNFLALILNIALCLVIPNVILYIIFRKSEELNFYKELVLNGMQSLSKKVRRNNI